MARLAFSWRWYSLIGVVVVAVSIALLSGGLSAGLTRIATAAGISRGGPPALVWHGGPVQHHPRLYLLFWGLAWQTDPAQARMKQAVEDLFGSLAGGQYNNILSQYGDNPRDPEAYVHNDVRVAGEWLDPQGPPDGVAITTRHVEREIDLALASNPCDPGSANGQEWCVSLDAQFMVFAQRGTHYGGDLSGGCGMHSSYLHGTSPQAERVIFSQIRYAGTYPDTACADASMLPTATHEYAETATDPLVGPDPAWNTDARWFGTASEIGDLCGQFGANSYVSSGGPGGPNAFFFVARLWDNASHSCALARGQEFYSSAAGKHTVQGAILRAYQGTDPTGLGGPGGPLGYPTSQEYSILGGRQSAFQHGMISYSFATGQTSMLLGDGSVRPHAIPS
jgi:hypothetical protein